LGGILGLSTPLLYAIRKDVDMPKIPYQHEYLMELLNRGYFYGDSTNLVKLESLNGMPLRINEPPGEIDAQHRGRES